MLYVVELDLDTLRAWHGTGAAFTSAYLDFFRRGQHLEDLEQLGAVPRMWLDYALSTIHRGRDLIAAIEPWHSLAGARYLDVGCGFGGALVAAAEAGAFATGIEIDLQRLDFTRLNLGDFQLEGRVAALSFSALDPALPRALGRFDIISCNDVAEHVDDVELLFANLRALLRPGGLVYIEVPNRHDVDFVAADGHFGLFAITLLEHADARAYHQHAYPGAKYDVGEYLAFDDYSRLFLRHGLQPRLIDSLYHPARELATLDDALARLEEAAARFSAPAPIAALLRARYARYRAQLAADLHALDAQDFRQRYLRSFWTFLGYSAPT